MRALWIVAAVVAVALPFAVPNPYYQQVVATAYTTAIAVYGLNVILGYTGLLNLGNAGFFGIGAYTVALLETKAGIPFWPALAAGCLASTALGVAVGSISLRTRGHYFAIFTAAIGVMIEIVLSTWQDLTNGNIGIANIAPPPPLGPLSFESSTAKYYLVLASLALAIAVCALVRRSLFGRTLRAIESNEHLARSVGVDVMRAKLLAFALSTFLAGLGGGMFAMYVGFLGPDSSGIDATFEQLLYLVVGGIGTIGGPLIGTLVLTVLGQALQSIERYRFLVFGPLLVLLVIFFPYGIAGALARIRPAPGKRRGLQPAADSARS
ncbi:MAG: branched-chain amino acid ABC transporter permease [Vulcanimicrobiaceae bacterium]